MASISVPCPKVSSSVAPRPISARLPAPIPKFASFGQQLAGGQHNGICRLQAKLNQVVTAETNSNCATIVASPEEKVGSAEKIIPDTAEISAFMGQVSDLIKLVDSRDIAELELKQLGCEVRIRKKEALQQVAPASPVVTMPQFMAAPPASAAPAPPAHSPVSPAPSALPAPAMAKTGGTSHPPLKCPMAGTFYRCPGPGEPPFVKVGDKVQKGQVVCIIEAMKLMNEIEADRSGTITEILVEDGKPVSVDLPLFVIAP